MLPPETHPNPPNTHPNPPEGRELDMPCRMYGVVKDGKWRCKRPSIAMQKATFWRLKGDILESS